MEKKPSVDDLLPFLMGEKPPLWEGTDDVFAQYVHESFGIPTTITSITIVPRVVSGRAAVAIGGEAGAIVFVLSNDNAAQQLHIDAHVMGPIHNDPDVLLKAKRSGGTGGGVFEAVSMLLMRHLTPTAVADLLLPPTVH
jgi:hypothetical protein